MEYQIYENRLTYEDYAALRASVGWRNFCREQAEQALRSSFYTLLVKDRETSVAMARVTGDGMYFLIADVIVRPEYQGKGIGTELLQTVLAHIETSLPPGSRASIQLLSEPGKEAFYMQQGFKLVPHEFCGPALRKVIHK